MRCLFRSNGVGAFFHIPVLAVDCLSIWIGNNSRHKYIFLFSKFIPIISNWYFPDQFVHVRFCACNGNSYWVKGTNVFEFSGYDSLMEIKRTMKSVSWYFFCQRFQHGFIICVWTLQKLSDEAFDAAFNTDNDKDFHKAVVEATFVMNKELDMRLAFFEILKI